MLGIRYVLNKIRQKELRYLGLGLLPGDRHYRAYVGPPEDYDLIAAMTFNLITTLGLRQDHTVLDIGCGSLRIGRLLIPYLNVGNYSGIDPNRWLIDKGIKNEIGKDQIKIKQPRFYISNSAKDLRADAMFDFAIAQSIFSHCGPDLLEGWLMDISAHLKDSGALAATFCLGDQDCRDLGWFYPDAVHYKAETLASLSRNAGLNFVLIDWKHPRQQWALFVKPQFDTTWIQERPPTWNSLMEFKSKVLLQDEKSSFNLRPRHSLFNRSNSEFPLNRESLENRFKSMAPRISVCIPTYNYANFIPYAIESVLRQSFEDFEVIVQDDCSSDNTEEVVAGFLSDPRVKFSRNERNLGLAANWNLCLRKSRGQYIKYVFADDFLTSKDTLSEMVRLLDSDNGVSLVASAREIVDSKSTVLHVESSFHQDLLAPGTKIIRKCLYERRNLIGEPTAVMFRKDQAERGFNGEYQHLLDIEMWFHLLEKGKFAHIDRPLCAFRVHPAQKTAENVRSRIYLDDYYLLLRQYLERPYIRAGRVLKNYLLLDTVYQFWKLYKRGILERSEALERIKNRLPSFFLVYPFFKVAKPFIKIYLSLLKSRAI
jgi:glycosyltransferase involved in cell wall biosynthesis/SAM-dependent methyltransferase